MFEYVTKAEYQPVREELEKIIKQAQSIMRTEYDLTFQFKLIGSGKKHLITRVIGGNQGFDFDYNLIIPTPDGFTWKAKVVKQQFMSAFQKALGGSKYSAPQDSTSSFTIKVVDRANKKILHSCDFAIIYYDEGLIENGYFYLHNNKVQNYYSFEKRELSRNIEDKLQEIKNFYVQGWNLVRDEYLKIKNRNIIADKHSFVLYLEAINNVYNQMKQHPDY